MQNIFAFIWIGFSYDLCCNSPGNDFFLPSFRSNVRLGASGLHKWDCGCDRAAIKIRNLGTIESFLFFSSKFDFSALETRVSSCFSLDQM